MLFVGKGIVGRFELVITPTSPFHPDRLDLTLDYYDCLVTEILDARYYVNLNKDERFIFINYKYPPKPPVVKKKKLRSGEVEEEEVPDTLPEAIYRVEFASFERLKDLQQPMWRLHRTNVSALIEVCDNLSIYS